MGVLDALVAGHNTGNRTESSIGYFELRFLLRSNTSQQNGHLRGGDNFVLVSRCAVKIAQSSYTGLYSVAGAMSNHQLAKTPNYRWPK